MILSELIPFLKNLDARPRKSLSQNFLIDPNVVKKIVLTADIQPGDRVLEIGPGPGALTQELLRAGAHVWAVELDPLFAKELPRLQTSDQRLHVFHTDFLKFPLDDLAPFTPLKVVANLPYHITTPILEKLCTTTHFSSLTIMVQKEVVDRMTASSGTKEFSSFTLFLQYYCKLHKPFKVAPGCFYPRPKVDSAVIRLDLQTPPSIDPSSFFTLTRKAFQQRRKMLSTSLQSLFPASILKEALLSIGLKAEARPEELALEKWIELHIRLFS
jgi:16S rRNA (adenine1518-N6/adenine1519-N6)-dimethyltransferase